MKLNSIVIKMMIPLLAVTTLVVAVTLLVTQTFLRQVVEDIFVDLKVQHFRHVDTLQIDNILSNIMRDGISLASSYNIEKFVGSNDASQGKIPKKVLTKLQEFKSLYNLDTIYIADAKSRNYFNEKGFVKVVDPTDKQSAWFLNTLRSKQRFLINADSDITGRLHIWIDTIIGDIDNPIGLAGGGVDVSDILQMALEEFKQNDTNAFIMDQNNIILNSSQGDININNPLAQANFSPDKKEAIKKALHNKDTLVKYYDKRQTRYLLFSKIEKLNWTVVIDFSKEKFLDSFHGVYDRIIIGGAALLFLLMIIAGWSFTYLISRPLKEISRSLEKFDHTLDFEPIHCQSMGYEIDMICNAFNKSSKLLHKALESHKNNEELLRSIINATDDLIFFKDTQNRYLGCNKAYEKWSSKSLEELVGKKDIDLYSYNVANIHMQIDKEVLSSKKTIVVEEEFVKDNGNTIILQVQKSPFKNNSGDIKGIVVVARDITLMKDMEKNLRTLNATLEKRVNEKTSELQIVNDRLEEHIFSLEVLNSKLIKTKEEALQAAQAKSNFISSISHELRTPLNAIINFTDQIIEDFDEMLEDKELQTDAKVFLQRVMVNSRHLLQLINDLLEFTKVEAGKMEYRMEPHNLNEIIQTAYNNTHSLLNGTNVDFYIKTDEKPLVASVDSRRFLQVLLNLLSNAIKFTHQGSVEIRSFAQENFIIIEIEDTGKGIPLEKQKNIFDPFMQVDSMDYGTGLGLGLVKRMCDDMNIEVTLFSEVGKGTIFRVTLRKSS